MTTALQRFKPLAIAASLFAGAAPAASTEGGLYVAGAGFDFKTAAQQALAKNSQGRRFFLLVLPAETVALTPRAGAAQAALRERVQRSGGVILVCQRDIDDRRVDAAQLAPGVVAVRGWSAADGVTPDSRQRSFAGEDAASLPASEESLRRLRSTCARP